MAVCGVPVSYGGTTPWLGARGSVGAGDGFPLGLLPFPLPPPLPRSPTPGSFCWPSHRAHTLLWSGIECGGQSYVQQETLSAACTPHSEL